MRKTYVVKTTSPCGENQQTLSVEGADSDLLVEGATISLDVKVEGVAEEDLAAELKDQKESFQRLSDNYNDCLAQLEAEQAKTTDLQSKLDDANKELAALKTPADENTSITEKSDAQKAAGAEQNGGGEASQEA